MEWDPGVKQMFVSQMYVSYADWPEKLMLTGRNYLEIYSHMLLYFDKE